MFEGFFFEALNIVIGECHAIEIDGWVGGPAPVEEIESIDEGAEHDGCVAMGRWGMGNKENHLGDGMCESVISARSA